MPANQTAGTRPRLLIADDDPSMVSILAMTLGEEFEIVGAAADASEAVELARESQPHAALVDVEMPGGGGIGAVRGIVDVAPGTAIVVLSADESDGSVRDLIGAGAVAYLRKGSRADIVADTLRDSIRVRADEPPAAS